MGDIESYLSSPNNDERALEHVARFINEISDDGDMVHRFVLIVETVDQEDRWLSTFTMPGQKAWDSLGLLDFAATMERNAHMPGDA